MLTIKWAPMQAEPFALRHLLTFTAGKSQDTPLQCLLTHTGGKKYQVKMIGTAQVPQVWKACDTGTHCADHESKGQGACAAQQERRFVDFGSLPVAFVFVFLDGR